MLSRRWISRLACLLIGVFLFGQLAVAAYACPGMSSTRIPEPMAIGSDQANDDRPASTAPDSDCGAMGVAFDPAAPNLCAEHCKFGGQGDRTAYAGAPEAVPVVLYPAPPTLAVAHLPRSVASSRTVPVAASPPHAILHCVYRI